ncbi:MAG: exonuclease SbcCD subunit [Clostridiales bacterium]|nr:exonuclease SbcCD subunit [Clostridiales bacterium]
MRILHTSDWHLGRIFHGVHLTEDQAYILEQLVELIKDRKPDVILVAGDIFDRSVPPVEAVNLLDDTLSKILMDYKIPTIMISGNHDSPDRVDFGSRLMEESKLHIIGRYSRDIKPVVIQDIFGPVYFYPLPYVEPAIVRESMGVEIHSHDEAMHVIMDNIKSTMKMDKRNVLITHTFTAGGEASESERPLTIGGSSVVDATYFNDFNYVALGHLHRPQRIGGDNIRYSGSLMKYSFSEAAQKKNIPIIEMDEKGNVSVETVELKPRRDLRCIEGHLEDILKGPQNGESREDYIMVTLKDEGAILDAMGKVRSIYPNTLHIERPQFISANTRLNVDSNFRKMDISELFSSFFKQVTDIEMSEEQKTAFSDMVSKLNNSLRGE